MSALALPSRRWPSRDWPRERRRVAGGTLSSRRALLAIELRLKLEEQVLLPRFCALGLPALETLDRQIELFRELLGEAALGELALPLPSNRLLWASIERMGTLHSTRWRS